MDTIASKTTSPSIFFLLLFSFIPFVSPIAFPSDTQPFFILFLVYFYADNLSRIKLDVLDLCFLVFAALEFFFASYRFDSFKDVLPYAVIPFLFVAFRRLAPLLTHSVVRAVLVFNALGFIVQYTNPSLFYKVSDIILRVSKIQSSDRALTGFAPESGLMSGLLFFYLLIILTYRRNFYSQAPLKLVVDLALLSFCIISSISGSSLIYILLLLVAYLLFQLFQITTNLIRTLRIPLYPLAGLSALVGLALTLPSHLSIYASKSRFIFLLTALIQRPSLLLLESSVSSRYVPVYVSLKTLLDYPYGIPNYSQRYPVLAPDYLTYQPFLTLDSLTQGSNSAFAEAIFSFGLIHLVFVAFLFVALLIKTPVLKLPHILCFVFGLIFHLFAFGSLFPPTWFLLAVPFASNDMMIFERSH